jgi:hypothetical protein
MEEAYPYPSIVSSSKEESSEVYTAMTTAIPTTNSQCNAMQCNAKEASDGVVAVVDVNKSYEERPHMRVQLAL